MGLNDPEPASYTFKIFGAGRAISGGFRGGALGASAPPAESIVKKILTYLFSSQCTVGTFLCVL